MSDTPRTDAQLALGPSGQWADFARQLERELAEAKADAESWANQADDRTKDCVEQIDRAEHAKQRIAALERELAEAKEVADAYSKGVYSATLLEWVDAIAKSGAHGFRIAALEQTLREVRSLISPYTRVVIRRNDPIREFSQALALIDRTLEPRDE